jgi:transposase
LLPAAEKAPHSQTVPAIGPPVPSGCLPVAPARLPQLVQLGETLNSWSTEIATMWRFTRNNAITEDFHTKMEVLQRQAYGFRNFQNYRLRVRVMCS